jgi:hypothetical protein
MANHSSRQETLRGHFKRSRPEEKKNRIGANPDFF